MTYFVDVNSDLGESFGAYKIGSDDLVMNYISSANIACGFHAGDYNVMQHSVKMAAEKKVGIGAHPGLPDLIGFGRRPMKIAPQEIYNLIIYQVGALQAFARSNHNELNHVKPHGALYNMAVKDPEIAQAIAEAVYAIDPNLILFGLAGSELVKAGKKTGIPVAEEVFADRTYQPDGSLTPRTLANAMVEDATEAVSRVIRMIKDGKVEAVDGSDITINADTICIHGDEPKSLEFAKRLCTVLTENGIIIKRVGK
ncbi:5-oxoprolinase subunit PxpA [Oceanobacillus sp. FSL K6-2867]|uniref:LamB/YcsF family protein n=1 Tax=Oceanobacillus sp. FSL K6-2867 TaxID=2954748 RepID=UPI0030D848F1